MRWYLLVLLLPGCVYFHDGADDDGDCANRVALRTEPVLLRDPTTLRCASYSTYCDPACGDCPAFAPEPTFGVCGSSCEALDEYACEASPDCRVAKYASCEIEGNCFTSFLGCFPVDRSPDASVDCFAADAWACSRSNECTALHSTDTCPADAACDQPFELCVPEGASPGRCTGQVACDALPPSCPAGTTPGIGYLCWTGACIPDHLCD